jgi:hypothetical protein
MPRPKKGKVGRRAALAHARAVQSERQARAAAPQHSPTTSDDEIPGSAPDCENKGSEELTTDDEPIDTRDSEVSDCYTDNEPTTDEDNNQAMASQACQESNKAFMTLLTSGIERERAAAMLRRHARGPYMGNSRTTVWRKRKWGAGTQNLATCWKQQAARQAARVHAQVLTPVQMSATAQTSSPEQLTAPAQKSTPAQTQGRPARRATTGRSIRIILSEDEDDADGEEDAPPVKRTCTMPQPRQLPMPAELPAAASPVWWPELPSLPPVVPAAAVAPVDAEDKPVSKQPWRDLEGLRQCCEDFHAVARTHKSDGVILTLLIQRRINSMEATLNLFFDPDLMLTLRKASIMAAKAVNRGQSHALQLRRWITAYMHDGTLPTHRLRGRRSILSNEDIKLKLHSHLLELQATRDVQAQDVCDYMASDKIKAYLGRTYTIKLNTASSWMAELAWSFGGSERGMYIDGHEREDVRQYRTAFLERWTTYEERMLLLDRNAVVTKLPHIDASDPARSRRLVLYTHDESTFYSNDRRKQRWIHPDMTRVPQPKDQGESLMVADLLSPEFGRLQHEEE